MRWEDPHALEFHDFEQPDTSGVASPIQGKPMLELAAKTGFGVDIRPTKFA